MRLEELNSLNENELTMLWYALNLPPQILADVEINPSSFCAVKQQAIQSRLSQIENLVKDEYKSEYISLLKKLNLIQNNSTESK